MTKNDFLAILVFLVFFLFGIVITNKSTIESIEIKTTVQSQPTITIQQINTKLTIEDILKKYDGKSLTIIITKETI